MAKASDNVFTKEERAAVQETARERKKSSKLSPEQERAEGEADVQAKIAGMPADDKAMATRIHKLVLETVPTLVPKTYYGMPAYAMDGKVICFFKPKSKFKVRYSTFEFQTDAGLDDGDHLAGFLRRVEADAGDGEADRRAGQEGREPTVARAPGQP